MKHAHTNNYAASGAGRGRLARLVGRGVLACALAVAGAGTAFAQQSERDARRDEAAQQRGDRFQADQRFEQRAFEREEQRRQMQMQQEQQMRNADAARRSGRLTPDERRDLRRQISEAGMDLYQNPPRR